MRVLAWCVVYAAVVGLLPLPVLAQIPTGPKPSASSPASKPAPGESTQPPPAANDTQPADQQSDSEPIEFSASGANESFDGTSASTGEWQSVTSSDGQFTVSAPAAPVTVDYSLPDGQRANLYVSTSGGAQFMFLSAPVGGPVDRSASSVQTLGMAILNGMAARARNSDVNCAARFEGVTTYGGLPAATGSVVGSGGAPLVKVRVLIVGTHFAILAVSASAPVQVDPLADRFFATLTWPQ